MIKLLLFLAATQAVPDLPIRIIHWLNPFCLALHGTQGNRCMETAKGLDALMKSSTIHAKTACQKIKADPSLQNGFYVIAYTFGGYTVRKLLHTCPEAAALIKRIVFINVPHLGITKVPDNHAVDLIMGPKERLLKITSADVKKSLPIVTNLEASIILVGAKALIAQFWDKLGDMQKIMSYALTGKRDPADTWLLESTPAETHNVDGKITPFLKELNSNKHDAIYANLDMLVNVVSKHDILTIPVNSVTFGVDLAGDNSKVLDASDFEFYKTHKNGVGKLYETGRLWNCVSNGAPEFLKHKEIKAIKTVLLSDDADAADYPTSAKNQLKKFLTAYPVPCTGKNA